jgi:serine phosphatase RsbU (regulator of sigma subunit)
VGIVSIGTDARVLSANAAALAMLQRSEAELIGLDAHEALNGVPGEGCDLEAAVRSGRAEHYDADIFRTGDGEALPVWWAINPLRDGDEGSLLGAVLVFGDSTVQRAQAAADARERAQGRADLADARQSIADLEWVAATSQALASTLDEVEVTNRLARLTVGRLADLVISELVDANGVHRSGYAIADGIDLDLDLDAVLAGPGFAQADPVETRERGPRSRALLAAVGAVHVLAVPLIARGETVGTLTLIRREGSGAFSDVDDLVASDIALRAALAIDNARLFRAQADIASRLQHALLPELPPLPIRAAVRYLPARDRFDVGGDWYDAFRLPDDTIALVVGDVAGHDLAAGTTMSALRNLLRGVSVVTHATPGEVLRAVDESLQPLAISGTATVLLAHLRPQGRGAWSLRWSNAGHLPPLLLPPGGGVEQLDEVHGSLLGTGQDQVRPDSERILPAGSTLVFYTDGLVETPEESIEAGLVRLRRTAVTLSDPDDPDAVADELLATNHASAEDDTALLVCHLPVLRD